MSQLHYYREQEAGARQIAETATLANVRSRYLQSAAAWAQLADRAEQLERIQALGIVSSS